ncbi:hypothetical protein T492DRAFT_834543 [Pavlovales sp. CCMP2436]|nr:hypothetical protein T492DRAFT_834543 [Pavlovales sp. CCMP2436]
MLIFLFHQVKKQELDEYLRAHQAEAAIAARAKLIRVLIRVVMHDLRSPLLTIRNIGESLRGGASDELANKLMGRDAGTPKSEGAGTLADKMVVRQVDALRSCVTTMENIMNDMLDFERIDSGRLVLVHRAFTLGQLTRTLPHPQGEQGGGGVEEVFSSQALLKKVELTFVPMLQSLSEAVFIGDIASASPIHRRRTSALALA